MIKVSLFNDRSATAISVSEVDWDTLCAHFSRPPVVPDKAQALLFSLCEFGDKRTERGSLRSNDNVLRVYGACGDYDGETVQPERAVEALRSVGVRALVYTSPSHSKEAPRWRVVLPFDTPGDANDHAAAVEKLNGIIGGGLSSESFTLSQPFYIGQVQGREFVAYRVEGRDIRSVDTPRMPWRGSQNADGGYRVATQTLLEDLQSGVEIHPAIVSLAMRGFSADELIEIVDRYKSGWVRPERAEVAIREDIPRACDSATRKKQIELEKKIAAVGVPPEPPRKPTRFPMLDQLVRDPAPLRWLVKGIIEHPTLICLFGDPGAGKSFLSLAWALAIATGGTWQGREVMQGRVVYMAGEGFSGLKRRYMAWLIENGVRASGVPFHATERAWPVTDYETLTGIYNDLDALPSPPVLIVIDTLTRHTPGMDQNSPKEMPEFVRVCDDLKSRYGCSVLVVHHSGHGDKGRAMGSMALKGAVDVEISASRKGDIMTVHSTKMKDGQPFEDLTLHFKSVDLPWKGDDGSPQSSAVLVETGPPDVAGVPPAGAEPVMSDKARLVCEILREGPKPKDEARDDYRRLISKPGELGARSFNFVLKGLISSGRVIHDGDRDELRLPLEQPTTPTSGG